MYHTLTLQEKAPADGAAAVALEARGSGRIEVRCNGGKKILAAVELPKAAESAYKELNAKLGEVITGVQDIQIIFDGKGICLKSWRAER